MSMIKDRSHLLRRTYKFIISMCIFTGSLVLFGCLPEPNLNYPEEPKTFSDEIPEIEVREEPEPLQFIDASVDLGVNSDMMQITPDLGIPDEKSILRTLELQWVGVTQETYQEGPPQVRGSFQWTLKR